MCWRQYRIIFKLTSPLHIGYRKIGNLMQTRSYVPGKNLWAALTARITRDNDKGNDGKAYEKTGKEINEKFRFTYLWPAISPDNTEVKNWDDLTTYFTFEDQNNNNMKKIYPMKKENNRKPFDYLFLDSYASTSLDYERQGAEEGSLHEVEFISPVTRDAKQVYVAGSIWVKELPPDIPEGIKNWQKSIEKLSIGGEQKYGWGRLELIECEKLENNSLEPDEFLWNSYVPVHIDVEGAEEIHGSLEPLVGWETKEDNLTKIRDAKIAFTPGSIIQNKAKQFKIIENGLWKVIT